MYSVHIYAPAPTHNSSYISHLLPASTLQLLLSKENFMEEGVGRLNKPEDQDTCVKIVSSAFFSVMSELAPVP